MTMRLFTPGPVTVPAAVMAACAAQPLHHRSAAFKDMSHRVWTGLASLFRTQHDVSILAGSGMTGIEAAIASTVHAGDMAVVLDNGRFGGRLSEILRRYECTVVDIVVPWGESIASDVVAAALASHPTASSLWMVHSETSTGVTLDIAAIARACRSIIPDIIIGVDAITGIGVQRVETDGWDLDLVVSASQKGLMCPPGLAAVSISPRAEARMRSRRPRPYTLDLTAVLDHQRKGLFTWTPPVTLVAGLDVAIQLMEAEGLDAVWQRHADVTAYLHASLRARGLSIFGEATSHAVTVVAHANADAIRRHVLERHDIMIAGGQDRTSGRVFRIGTCGAMQRADIDDLLVALDDVLTIIPPLP